MHLKTKIYKQEQSYNTVIRDRKKPTSFGQADKVIKKDLRTREKKKQERMATIGFDYIQNVSNEGNVTDGEAAYLHKRALMT